MELIAINETFEENADFASNPLYNEMIQTTMDFYKKVGFVPPWIGYLVTQNTEVIGGAGFKGVPQNGTVEIAYGTFDPYKQKGFGTAICKLLVDLSLKTDPSVKITARTFSEENFSTRILVKNNFSCIGTVYDPEDGEVWEWLYNANE